MFKFIKRVKAALALLDQKERAEALEKERKEIRSANKKSLLEYFRTIHSRTRSISDNSDLEKISEQKNEVAELLHWMEREGFSDCWIHLYTTDCCTVAKLTYMSDFCADHSMDVKIETSMNIGKVLESLKELRNIFLKENEAAKERFRPMAGLAKDMIRF